MVTIQQLADELGVDGLSLVKKARAAGYPAGTPEDELAENDAAFLRTIARMSKGQVKAYVNGVRSPFKTQRRSKLPVSSLRPTSETNDSITRENEQLLSDQQPIDLENREDATSEVLERRIDAKVSERLKNALSDDRVAEVMGRYIRSEIRRSLDELWGPEIQALQAKVSRLQDLATPQLQIDKDVIQQHLDQLLPGSVSDLAERVEECNFNIRTLMDTTATDFTRMRADVELLQQQIQEVDRIKRNTDLMRSSLQRLEAQRQGPDATDLSQIHRDLDSMRRKSQEVDDVKKNIREMQATLTKQENHWRTNSDAVAQVNRKLESVESSLGSRFSGVADEIGHLKMQLKPLLDQHSEIESTFQRLIRAREYAPSITNRTLTVDVGNAVEQLESHGIFFDPAVVNQCLRAIKAGEPLLLTGPPGVGKSTLAQQLPRLFSNQAHQLKLRTIDTVPSWHSFNILGGPWIAGDRIVPRLGLFSETIIQSIEEDGKLWLFIDEINRCDVDRAFGGLLAMLGSLRDRQAVLRIPEFSDPIAVPPSFRLIVAMNTTDSRHLMPISQAFLTRFREVRVATPDPDVERKIIEAIIARNNADKNVSRGGTILRRILPARQSPDLNVEPTIVAFLNEISRLRNVCSRLGADEYSPNLRFTLSTFSDLDSELLKQGTEVWLDTVISRGVVPSLARSSYSVMGEILQMWTAEKRLPNSISMLQLALASAHQSP